MTASAYPVRETTTSQFLRLCLRAHHDAAVLDALRAFVAQHELDWQDIRRAANVENVSQLVYYTLRHEDILPAALAEEFRNSYRLTSLRNILLAHELGEALHRLNERGIRAVVLKGLALAETVYANIALRPMGDIDLLIRDEDRTAVMEALGGLGYAAPRLEVQAGAAAAYECELLLEKKMRIVVQIDLHWTLFDSPYYQRKLDLAWWWATIEPISIGRAPGWTLGPEAQLLHLCGHLMLHHQGQGLLWLNDIAGAIGAYRDRIAWDELVARARAYDLVSPTQTVLRRAAAELSAPVPPKVLERLEAIRPSWQEVRIFTWLTAEERPVAQRFWADVASIAGWRDRLRFAWINLFPSPAYMRQRYRIAHPVLLPLYYPYRWIRGLLSAL